MREILNLGWARRRQALEISACAEPREKFAYNFVIRQLGAAVLIFANGLRTKI